MRNYSTKSRFIACLILITSASFVFLSFTYARYTAQAEGTGTASVALWGADSAIREIDVDVSTLSPGGSESFELIVTNTKNGKVSQTAQNYSIAVETTGNLPLKFSLAPTGEAPEGSRFVDVSGGLHFSGGKTAAAGGGFLPHTASATHAYTLTVSWPPDDTGAGYADEIDMVTLIVNAKQAVPGGTQ